MSDDRSQGKHLFGTRSHSWREAGLARQLSRRAVKRARIQAFVLVPVLVAILVRQWTRRPRGYQPRFVTLVGARLGGPSAYAISTTYGQREAAAKPEGMG